MIIHLKEFQQKAEFFHDFSMYRPKNLPPFHAKDAAIPSFIRGMPHWVVKLLILWVVNPSLLHILRQSRCKPLIAIGDKSSLVK